MVPHPATMHVVTELRRGDLLAAAERERRADAMPASFSEKDHWVFRTLTLLALVFGFRV